MRPTDTAICYGQVVQVIGSGNQAFQYQWLPTVGIANPDVSTLYIVTGITEHGCAARDSINVYRSDEAVLAIPNAFAPGSNGNNQFMPITRGISQLIYFRVYNRWGNVVFETRKLGEGWDGSWKGEAQPFGVYVYDIQAISLTGKIINKSGNVTLLR